MRIICNACGSNANINKTNRMTNEMADIYVTCSNSECGHRFVSKLHYSHTLNESRLQMSDKLKTVLSLLDNNGIEELKGYITEREHQMRIDNANRKSLVNRH